VADWDSRFMGLALHVAEWSKRSQQKSGLRDCRTVEQIRAVGYNGFPKKYQRR